MRTFGIALMAGVAAACGGDAGPSCTADIRPSVDLEVIDDAGARLSAVQVDYRVDGGAQATLVCDGVCWLETERPGSFAITASKAGWQTASTVVAVARDECHVITRSVVLVLRPEPSTARRDGGVR